MAGLVPGAARPGTLRAGMGAATPLQQTRARPRPPMKLLWRRAERGHTQEQEQQQEEEEQENEDEKQSLSNVISASISNVMLLGMTTPHPCGCPSSPA